MKKSAQNRKEKKEVMEIQKLKILDLLREGERGAALAKRYNVNESTIRSIRAD